MFVLVAAAIALADPAGVNSGRSNQIHVSPPRIEVVIVVDGILDEAAWAAGGAADRFFAVRSG